MRRAPLENRRGEDVVVDLVTRRRLTRRRIDRPEDPAVRQLEVRLRPWERRRLTQLRDHAASARLVKRAMCLLLSGAGQRATAIARVTGLSLDAVTDVRRRWRERRLRSLADRTRSGRPPLVTTEYRRQLRRALRMGPLACGYVFTVWSIARLGTHLLQRTGVAHLEAVDAGVEREEALVQLIGHMGEADRRFVLGWQHAEVPPLVR